MDEYSKVKCVCICIKRISFDETFFCRSAVSCCQFLFFSASAFGGKTVDAAAATATKHDSQ